MFEYQDVGIGFLSSTPRAGLFDEPGLGKSRQFLLSAKGRTLLVAPAMAIDGGVYADEMEKWQPDIDLTCVPYSSLTTRVRGPRGGSVPTTTLRPEFQGDWDTVICDESHYLKGRGTHWTKAIFGLRTDRLFLATGTPLPNWAADVFTTAQLLRPEHAVGGGELGSYWRWAARWFQVGPTRWSPMKVGDPLADTPAFWREFNDANLGGRYLLRTWDEVAPDLPPFRIQPILCPMVPKQAKAYREMKKQFLTELESGTEVVAWSHGSRETKLARIATGLDLEDRTVHASGKMDRLAAELEQRPNDQVFIVGQFRDTVELCQQVAGKLGRPSMWIHGGSSQADRKRAVAAFKSGEVQDLCGTIDLMRESLNFEHCHTCIRVERSWLPGRNDQVIRRIRRISSNRPKHVIDLITPNTVDAKMLPVLAKKSDQQMKAMPKRDLRQLV